MLAHETGLRYSGGRFKKEEEAIIEQITADYCETHDLSRSRLLELLQPSSPVPEMVAFLRSVCRKLPGRPLYIVHRHLKARLADRQHGGAWSSEEDEELLRLLKLHGVKAVSTFKIGVRTGKDCSDRYYKHLRHPIKKSGRWSPEEEEHLKDVVRKAQFTIGGFGSTGRIKWDWVAKRIKDRTPQQCRAKWACVKSNSKLLICS